MEEFLPGRYMNPLSDFAFKRLFFNELNKDLLINFLNSIIGEAAPIKEIRYQPTIQDGLSESSRGVTFDIYCTNQQDEHFIIEMQKARHSHFRDRCLYYSTFPVQQQLQKGMKRFELKKVYMVAISDFEVFNEFEEDRYHYIEYVNLLRKRTQTIYSDKLNFVFVELPKFNKTIHELETHTDRWLFCLRNLSVLENRPREVQGRIFEKLFKLAEIQKLTTAEMKEYKKSVLEYEDVRDAVAFAREEARKEGEETGHEKGVEEGKQKIALKCLSKGMPIEEISDLTGLSGEEIRGLQ